ncbi:glycosyl transferase group 1 [Cellulomonas flavigena DSM 20109]|uniref:Glycosyl transferase group 1 n=1 Tax=Cellulomonas flavigena (strain ATCC 482 / DSM 20109 / BCRC 11376 / JCM 18109 / NBRC 3775 / NCIMB 8073 / NRS 134) TaxID=446466 RepID=D5UK58_CELFN|nr:glycosyltransferase [Cellulomonas flavigena]ADG73800.1 glycosyl transferase group 1 [Cellulomonas flavigena DSM 20109]
MTADSRRPGGEGDRGGRAAAVLVAHPGAELYGSDRVMLETVLGLRAVGRRVVVTVPVDGPLLVDLTAAGAEVVPVRTAVVRKSALRPAGFVRFAADAAVGAVRGWALLRRVRPDVVYVSTVTVPLWALLARLARRPVLWHVHEAEGSQPALVQRLLAAPLALATRVVANSHYSVDVLARSAPRAAARATVVLNAVPGPAEPTPARAALEGPLRLLYIGRLSQRKGVDVALEALGELRAGGDDVVLDLLGAVYPGYEWFEQQLRDRAAELGVTDAVRFLGFHPSIWPFLEEADAVVVPSVVDEPFGNTAVEAVLAARPLVVSATSGLLEAAAGYASAQQVPPGDVGALADAVRTVGKEWEQRRQDAMADAAVARERHAPEQYRRRLVEAVDAVVRRRA